MNRIPLVAALRYWRAERPDECKMDEFISSAWELYKEIERLKEEIYHLNNYIKQTSPRVDVDLCYTQNAIYRMVLDKIAIFSDYESAWQGCMRMQDLAREAVGEVLGE